MQYLLEDHPLSIIKQVEMEASKLQWVVSLAQWIPRYQVPDYIIEFLEEKIRKGYTNRYSVVNWLPQLREQVALHYYRKYKVLLDPSDNILITAGAIQAISAVLLSIINPGDNVILMDPCYASYSTAIKVARWNIKYIPFADKNKLNIEKIIDSIDSNTRAIILANPNNPNGYIISPEQIEKILQYINWKDIIFITDEVYDEFVFDWLTFQSSITLFPKYKENLVVINSWSKTFWMTGWRIGYLIADKKLISETIKVHDALITCAPVHSQWAALATFEIYDEWVKDVRKQLQQRRDYVISELEKLKWYISFDIPQASYFVFPKFNYTDNDQEEVLKILKKVKLALIPGSWFGNQGKWHFRICFGRDMESLEEGLLRLQEYYL